MKVTVTKEDAEIYLRNRFTSEVNESLSVEIVMPKNEIVSNSANPFPIDEMVSLVRRYDPVSQKIMSIKALREEGAKYGVYIGLVAAKNFVEAVNPPKY